MILFFLNCRCLCISKDKYYIKVVRLMYKNYNYYNMYLDWQVGWMGGGWVYIIPASLICAP